MLIQGYPLHSMDGKAGTVLFIVGLWFLSWRFPFGPDWWKGSLLYGLLLVISWYDIRFQLIFDKLLVFLGAFGIVFCFWREQNVVGMFLQGGLPASLALGWLRWITRGGLGYGDIKLVAVLGIWFSWQEMICMLVLSFLMGGVWAFYLLLYQGKNRRTQIAFGPFLAAGAYLTYLFGTDFLMLYRNAL